MTSLTQPVVFTFDIFGTVIDWYRGMREAMAPCGRAVDLAAFEQVIDWQGVAEQRPPHRRYQEIAAQSFADVLGLDIAAADRAAAELGHWPLFPDSAEGLRALMQRALCVATTNSDRHHGEQVQAQLGFRLSHWICAEDVRRYKPSPEFWRAASSRLNLPLSKAWWHVSAYGDYDLSVARSLGLTCVFVQRPHHRPGPADVTVPDLLSLASVDFDVFRRR
jgi:2-haloacid dehalogenase